MKKLLRNPTVAAVAAFGCYAAGGVVMYNGYSILGFSLLLLGLFFLDMFYRNSPGW